MCLRGHDRTVRHLGEQVVVHRIDQIQLRAMLDGLTQAMCEQGMILAQRAADNQNSLQLIHIR